MHVSLPPQVDPAVAAGYQHYLSAWAAKQGRHVDPVTQLLRDAVEVPPGNVPPRPNMAAPAPDVVAWAEATLRYHERRIAGVRSQRQRAIFRERLRALRVFADAIRARAEGPPPRA